MDSLESRLKQQASALGFARAGIASAGPAEGFDRLRDWLERGYAGEMHYLHRHAEARRHPASILPEVRSVVMLAMHHGSQPENEPEASATGKGHGRVARYARGADYHDVLRQRLKQLLAWVQAERPGCRGRAVVDTAPLLERDFARRAGLGWIGKNTMLLDRRLGSYFLLGALLLDLELTPDAGHDTSHCGRCTRCLDACPTGAFAGPGLLDARRCISYLTIELRGPIPEELRSGLGEWVFGCDVCQEVCPWNRKAPTTPGACPATSAGTGDAGPDRTAGDERGAIRGAFWPDGTGPARPGGTAAQCGPSPGQPGQLGGPAGLAASPQRPRAGGA